MILIYKKISKSAILKDAKTTIPQIDKWFTDNPKRRVCNAQCWYGKMRTIRRGHVVEDVNKAAQLAIKGI